VFQGRVRSEEKRASKPKAMAYENNDGNWYKKLGGQKWIAQRPADEERAKGFCLLEDR
jgi:hypothetical protein